MQEIFKDRYTRRNTSRCKSVEQIYDLIHSGNSTYEVRKLTKVQFNK